MSMEREIGELTANLATLQREMAETRADVRVLREFTEQARGSWKTVMAISGFAAAVGAVIGKVASVSWLR